MAHLAETHFRTGDVLAERIEAFRLPPGLPRHVALRVLIATGLQKLSRVRRSLW
jgi:hypothetical protein